MSNTLNQEGGKKRKRLASDNGLNPAKSAAGDERVSKWRVITWGANAQVKVEIKWLKQDALKNFEGEELAASAYVLAPGVQSCDEAGAGGAHGAGENANETEGVQGVEEYVPAPGVPNNNEGQTEDENDEGIGDDSEVRRFEEAFQASEISSPSSSPTTSTMGTFKCSKCGSMKLSSAQKCPNTSCEKASRTSFKHKPVVNGNGDGK